LSDEDALLSVGPLGAPPWPTRDPFLFCVHHDDLYPAGNGHFGPATSLAGRRMGNDFEGVDGWRMYHGRSVPGFPSHPHRGFETVTVVRRGLLDHSDSMGAAARYGQGDVQWLTAGRGIQHAEMFPLLETEGSNPVELFQIWLNLPRTDKMAEPHFSMLWNERIPRIDDAGVSIRVIAGALGELTPPSPPPSSYASKPDAGVAIWTLSLAPGGRWMLPPAPPFVARRLFFFRGRELKVGARTLSSGHYADVRSDVALPLENVARDEAEILLLQGRPIGEPVAQRGPFVMNDAQEIRQAFLDYQRTQFGGWPWPSDEPVHAREDRFARHADGRIERPA
jgi:redox-sensitive bicupin YhaK (pirin superfamily)